MSYSLVPVDAYEVGMRVGILSQDVLGNVVDVDTRKRRVTVRFDNGSTLSAPISHKTFRRVVEDTDPVDSAACHEAGTHVRATRHTKSECDVLASDEDEVVGFQVEDGDESLIYCGSCASDKSVPVTLSMLEGEEVLCAGTEYNSPEAHMLEPEAWEDVVGGGRLIGPLEILVPSPEAEIVAAVRESVETPRLADAIRELDAACVEHGVDGYDGEAVAYLDALLIMARHGHSAEDALVTAYGLKAINKGVK